MKKYFVTFLSPGTFVSEQDTREIVSWDVQTAIKMADKVIQRYGATPYAFYFSTHSRGMRDLDSKETARSGIYYLGGKILTLEQVKARKNPKDQILISNMEGNGIKMIIENTNSWKASLPFNDGDVLLDYTPPKKRPEARP